MTNRRKKVLVRPRVQVLAGLIVAVTVGVALLTLTLLAQGSITQLAASHPEVDPAFLRDARGELLHDLVVALLGLAPVAVLTGILMSFRIVGPIHRLETYLLRILRGEELGPCSLRAEDELHDFCDVLNDAVEKLRRAGQGEDPAAAGSADALPGRRLSA